MFGESHDLLRAHVTVAAASKVPLFCGKRFADGKRLTYQCAWRCDSRLSGSAKVKKAFRAAIAAREVMPAEAAPEVPGATALCLVRDGVLRRSKLLRTTAVRRFEIVRQISCQKTDYATGISTVTLKSACARIPCISMTALDEPAEATTIHGSEQTEQQIGRLLYYDWSGWPVSARSKVPNNAPTRLPLHSGRLLLIHRPAALQLLSAGPTRSAQMTARVGRGRRLIDWR